MLFTFQFASLFMMLIRFSQLLFVHSDILEARLGWFTYNCTQGYNFRLKYFVNFGYLDVFTRTSFDILSNDIESSAFTRPSSPTIALHISVLSFCGTPTPFWRYALVPSFRCFVHRKRIDEGKTLSMAFVDAFSSSLPLRISQLSFNPNVFIVSEEQRLTLIVEKK